MTSLSTACVSVATMFALAGAADFSHSTWVLDETSTSPGTTFRRQLPSFDIPLAPETMGYLLTKHHGGLAGQVVVTIRIDYTSGTPTFDYRSEPGNTCPAPATARPYIEKGGIYTRRQKTDTNLLRWWSNPIALPFAEGVSTISVPLQPEAWSSVYGRFGNESAETRAAFAETLSSAGYIGLTFGNGCFFGHGVAVENGTARFTVLDYRVE